MRLIQEIKEIKEFYREEGIALTNAFSLNMLNAKIYEAHAIKCTIIDKKRLEKWVKYNKIHNFIGHADLNKIVKQILPQINNYTKKQRKSINFNKYSVILVAQYSGSRLPENTTELPKDAVIQFWEIKKLLNAYVSFSIYAENQKNLEALLHILYKN